MNFNTLYYDISIKIYIRNLKIYKMLRLKSVKLDYEDGADIIKSEKLHDVFCSHIRDIISRYNTTIENIIIKNCDIKCDDSNISFTIINDTLVIHRSSISLSGLDADVKVSKNILTISVNNYSQYGEYVLNITDGDEVIDSYMYGETYTYHCSTKSVDINIVLKHNGEVIDTFDKHIELNSSYINKTNIYNKPVPVNNNPYDTSLFQNGLEYSTSSPYIIQSDDTQYFDIKAIFKSNVQAPIDIYPKVIVNYQNTLTYDYDVQKVFGDMRYTTTINQNGSILAKVVKYYAPIIKVEYNINCKVTHYYKPSSGTASYVTKDISVPVSYSADMKNYVYINDSSKTVEFVDEFIETPNNTTVYNIVYNKMKELYGSLENITLHGYSISNIKYYKDSIQISNRGDFIYPLFYKTSDNKVDTSKPVRYIIRPSYIYTVEDIVEATVTSTESTVINQASYSSLKNEFGDSYTGSSGVVYKVFILRKDSHVNHRISNGIVYASSNKTNSITKTFIFDDTYTSKTISASSDLSIANLSGTYTGSITVTCIGKSIYFQGAILTNGQSSTVNISGTIDKFVVGATGVVENVTLTKTDTLPKEGTYIAGINGNVVTFDTALKGKEDFVSKEEPFLIPGNAKNIRFDNKIIRVSPSNAVVTKQITQSTDTSQYSFTLKLSSSYIDKKIVTLTSYVGQQILSGFSMPSNYQMSKNITLNKPGTESSYVIEIESSNPNLIFEHSKNITFTQSTYGLSLVCKTSKHPANKWQLNVPCSYMYSNNQEYYTFTNNIKNMNAVNDKITINAKIKSQSPISVYSVDNDISLSRIISTEDDGISIKENILSDNNVFYTTYSNVDIESVTDLYGNAVNYESGTNYIIPHDSYSEIIVIYKVIDSFDFKYINGLTYIYINSNIKTFDVYYNKDNYISTDISLNPVHNLTSKGVVYYSNSSYSFGYANAYLNSISGEHTIILELKDTNGNPYISSNISISNATGTLVTQSDNTDINGVYRYIVKSATYSPSEIITVDGNTIKVGEIL